MFYQCHFYQRLMVINFLILTQNIRRKYNNVTRIRVDLSGVYDKFIHSLKWWTDSSEYTNNELANANTKSRLRMVTLYQIAGTVGGIVVGTGNKVEDFGVGFLQNMVMVV